MKEYFLGVDGGGTKSTAIVISKSSKKEEYKGKCLNYKAIGEEKFVENLQELISKIKNDVKFSCFALAGIDSERDKKKVERLIKENKIVSSEFVVVNDTKAVLPAADLENGVVAIAGTGSNFYAKNEEKEAWAGGLDYILSDEGSAFDIGQKVLRAAIKSSDGRGKKTILEKKVKEKERIKNIRELVNKIHESRNLKGKVAEFAVLTDRVDDKKTREILLSTVDELERSVETVARRVGLEKDFVVCLVGSVFKNKFIRQELEKRLKKKFEGLKIKKVENPAFGAAKLALNRKKR